MLRPHALRVLVALQVLASVVPVQAVLVCTPAFGETRLEIDHGDADCARLDESARSDVPLGARLAPGGNGRFRCRDWEVASAWDVGGSVRKDLGVPVGADGRVVNRLPCDAPRETANLWMIPSPWSASLSRSVVLIA